MKKHAPAQYKPIIIEWIKQYKNEQNQICDYCVAWHRGKRYMAAYQHDCYLNMLQVFEQQPPGIIDAKNYEQDAWNRLTQDQIEDVPQVQHTQFGCMECTALLIDLFMNISGYGKQVLAIPELNKGRRFAPLISWVLFKRASDPYYPLFLFADATKSIEAVVKQGEDILRAGKITPAEH